MFKEGDKVQIIGLVETKKAHGVSSPMKTLYENSEIGEIGSIKLDEADRSYIDVDFNGSVWSFAPCDLQKVEKQKTEKIKEPKLGDIVWIAVRPNAPTKTHIACPEMKSQFGKFGKVIDIEIGGAVMVLTADDNSWYWHSEDLRLIVQQADGTQFSLKRLLENVCAEYQDKLVQRFGNPYGLRTPINLIELLDYAYEEGQLNWLVDNGYIEILTIEKEEKPEFIPRKIGDRFRIKNEVHDNEAFMLSLVDEHGKVAAIGLKSGNRFRNPVTVDKIGNITREDMERIIGEDFIEYILWLN